MKSNKPIRVSVVEDDTWVRENLVREIGEYAGFECSGSYATGEAAIEAIPDGPPEVVVLDINLPGMDGIECLRRLRNSCPKLHFLMLTSYEESEKIFQSLRAGASGYLLKRADTAEVIAAIRQVHEGGAPMSSTIARQVVRLLHLALLVDHFQEGRSVSRMGQGNRDKRGEIQAHRWRVQDRMKTTDDSPLPESLDPIGNRWRRHPQFHRQFGPRYPRILR